MADSKRSGVPFDRACSALEDIAPLSLASDWDNVGLLIEPLMRARRVETVLMTIDLTGEVLDEALNLGADLIVAYHPPIFAGLKRLTQERARERTLLRAIREGVPIWTPHTALDSVQGGICDWLAEAFDVEASEAIEKAPGNEVMGMGRYLRLARPIRLPSLRRRIAKHINLPRLRVAASERHMAGEPIESIALCPGAGAEVLQQAPADVWLTGEMRHHDLLAATENGTSVLLTEHSNSERGYLPRFAKMLEAALDGEAQVLCSKKDRDPIA
ncbi:MAG: Nif3-like dinuclear metal center hexameric protein [Planctomycetota bacterium]|nr:MAG: Nif3-like dinuclear metal center hexameric protein [Planctomycetota bacterium]